MQHVYFHFFALSINTHMLFFVLCSLDSRMPGRTFKMVMKKVLVDQMVASPIVIALFFVTLGLMKRESMNETMIEIREKFVRLYKAEWVCIAVVSYIHGINIWCIFKGCVAISTSCQLLDSTLKVPSIV